MAEEEKKEQEVKDSGWKEKGKEEKQDKAPTVEGAGGGEGDAEGEKVVKKKGPTQEKSDDPRKDSKNWVKVIKSERSEKTGAYTFKEAFILKDEVKSFLDD
ncbi:MAG: DUF4295 family protein [Bacteroidetes bacterium]|nr:DUF4295 family protein [Bacteroidota bacterium]